MERIEFVRNYNDLSTDKGFQFEFHCDRCQSGFRTQFRPWAIGTASEVLDVASHLFGRLGTASYLGYRVKSAGWEKAHDLAFVETIRELKSEFMQCPHCLAWVCPKCWNEKRGLCKSCAPDMGVEMSAAQARRSQEEVWAHAAMSAEDKKLAASNWRETIVASCPECGNPLSTNARFCPECGASLKTPGKCSKCDATLSPGAKFCPECGQKV